MANQNDPYAAGEPDDVFVAPPTSPDDIDDDFAEPPGWPKAVGIISIVLGSINLICTGVGTGLSFVGAQMMQSGQSQMEGGLPPAITSPNTLIYVSTALALVWAIVLVVAGATTVSRKSIGRLMHMVWAVGAIALFVWGVSLQLQMQNEIADWVAQNPNSDFAQMSQGPGSQIGLMVGLVVGAIWGLAWPAFCLIWFGLIKTKPEQMTGGVESPAA